MLPTSGSPLGPGKSSSDRVVALGTQNALEARDVDKDAAIALGDRTRRQTFRPTFALTGIDRETPAMVAADKGAAVEFSLAEQRALMGATAVECAPAAASLQQDDVRPVGRQCERVPRR